MATLQEIRAVDDDLSCYHEETRERGYRFTKHGTAVVIERTRKEPPKLVADRMITPFWDAANAYNLVPANSGITTDGILEWDRRRRTLARNVDSWLDSISLRSDRKDAYRCWSRSDSTPHLICRYSRQFQQFISGSNWNPPEKYLALGRAVNRDTGIVELGSTLTADTLEELGQLCLFHGAGITIGPDDFTAADSSILIMDLDRSAATEGTFSAFTDGLEASFRIW